MATNPDPLGEIGAALFRLRRVWARPDMIRDIRARTPGGKPLLLSNLMVVHAVAALGPGGPCAVTGGEVTVGAVAEHLQIDPSTASRLVGYAIDAGLVTRQPSPADARRADLRLTDAGRRVKRVADRSRRTFIAGLTADWTDEERAEFARLLTRFTDAAGHSWNDLEAIGRIFEEAREEP
ncbi:MAG TPA: MarR family winged helix-turn-helix transcriptional regulator [Thermomonospora sp.]|nr:MarR family winged helix-turn-helix transcriptional regulator [Thermomonospora sp.]